MVPSRQPGPSLFFAVRPSSSNFQGLTQESFRARICIMLQSDKIPGATSNREKTVAFFTKPCTCICTQGPVRQDRRDVNKLLAPAARGPESEACIHPCSCPGRPLAFEDWRLSSHCPQIFRSIADPPTHFPPQCPCFPAEPIEPHVLPAKSTS